MRGDNISTFFRLKIPLLICLLLITSQTPLLAHNQQSESTSSNESYHTDIITFTLPDVTKSMVTNDYGEFTILSVPGTSIAGSVGQPYLPQITRHYAVTSEDVLLKITNLHVKETEIVGKLYPLQQPQSDADNIDDFIFDEQFYQQDILYPKQHIEIIKTGTMRNIPFIQIAWNPIQYNPAQGEIIIYDEITFELTYETKEKQEMSSDYIYSPFYSVYDNTFENWKTYEQAAITVTPIEPQSRENGCDYLLITHPNYYTQAKQLANWKHMKGLQTFLINVTDIGSTSSAIRSYIQTAYDTWDPQPSFVLLFGDAEHVPPNYVSSAASDLWYATVDGSDYFPDIFIGRLSADSTSEADILVQKILNYEQSPPDLDSFYENVACAAYFQDDENNGYETRRFVRTSEEIRDYLLTEDYNVERIYVTESYINPTHYNDGYYGNGEPLPDELLRPTFPWDGDATDIINALEQGIIILNHRDHGGISGWGDPHFDTSHISTLTNGELLPIVFSINCLTGRFDGNECFCEAFVRKDNGGAVAAFGATRVSYSGYNDFLCLGFYDAIWPDLDPTLGSTTPIYHLGGVINYGKTYMTQTWGDPWGYEELTFELFHVFGDPSMEPWTAVPGTLTVTYSIVGDDVEVIVKGDGSPIEGALVCLSQSQSGFYENAYTDSTGKVLIDISEADPEEEVSLVASGHNYLIYTESFSLNQKPEIPNAPSGTNKGKPGVEYLYSTSTIDPEDDRVLFNFSWGDGSYSGWVGPFDSGKTGYASHAWDEQGTYEIKVKAKDTKGSETDWSEPMSVSMPKTVTITNSFLLWFFEQFPNAFPLLRYLLDL